MNQSCRVCGEVAAGYHFGAFTCEGCKSFFGRTYNNRSSIGECKNNNQCIINKKNRTSCKSCRLKKCFSVGMSKSGSRYGRRSNWFKIHCLLQDQGIMQQQTQQQHQTQTQQLNQHQQQQHQQQQHQQVQSPQETTTLTNSITGNSQLHQTAAINGASHATSPLHHLHNHHNHQPNGQQLSPTQTADILSSMIAAAAANQQQQQHQQLNQNSQTTSQNIINHHLLQLQQQNQSQSQQETALANTIGAQHLHNHLLQQLGSRQLSPTQHLDTSPGGNAVQAMRDSDPAQVSNMYASAIAQFIAYCYLVGQRQQ